jgi:nitrogen fixation NifU-like protein
MVTELAKGKSVPEAQKITQQDILDALGGLPEESLHCALLAANTLKEAIKDYLASRKEPWKRAYKR